MNETPEAPETPASDPRAGCITRTCEHGAGKHHDWGHGPCSVPGCECQGLHAITGRPPWWDDDFNEAAASAELGEHAKVKP